jgi:tetratricopeptide (TPR) repeat protein
VNQLFHKNLPEAKTYYQKSIEFAKQTNAMNAGYYWSSVLSLGKIATDEKQYDQAQAYYKEVMDKAERKSSQFKEAKKALDASKKSRREERRKRK